jgi:hypothetical protein
MSPRGDGRPSAAAPRVPRAGVLAPEVLPPWGLRMWLRLNSYREARAGSRAWEPWGAAAGYRCKPAPLRFAPAIGRPTRQRRVGI